MRTNASKTRRTSISITRRVGAVSCGSKPSDSTRSCRRPKRSATSRPPPKRKRLKKPGSRDTDRGEKENVARRLAQLVRVRKRRTAWQGLCDPCGAYSGSRQVLGALYRERPV